MTGAVSDSRYEGYDDDDEEEIATPTRSAKDGRLARQLYDAAKRLRDDPTDMQADAALGEASAAVFAVDYLPDMDEDDLAAVGRVTRRLLGALGADEALEDEIRHQAEVLCRLVAPSAGEAEDAAEEARALARLEVAAAEETRRLVALPQSEVTPGGEMGAAVDRRRCEPGGDHSQDHISVRGWSRSVTPTLDGEDQDELDPDQVNAVDLSVARLKPMVEEEAGADAPDSRRTYGRAHRGSGDSQRAGGRRVRGRRVRGRRGRRRRRQRRARLRTGRVAARTAGGAFHAPGVGGYRLQLGRPDLTVAEEYETEVDGLFEQVHGPSTMTTKPATARSRSYSAPSTAWRTTPVTRNAGAPCWSRWALSSCPRP